MKTHLQISVVDYATGTCHIFEKVKQFKVCDFDPHFSDVHGALIVTLSIDFSVNDTEYNGVQIGNPLLTA